MKGFNIVFTLFLCLIFSEFVHAEKVKQCTHFKMDIVDKLFRAQVETNTGKHLQFDAIECMVNYLKESEDNINGSDPELNPAMLTTADPYNYGDELILGLIRINVLLANNNLVLGGKIGTPLYQNYNGIFMGEDLTINACIKYIVF